MAKAWFAFCVILANLTAAIRTSHKYVRERTRSQEAKEKVALGGRTVDDLEGYNVGSDRFVPPSMVPIFRLVPIKPLVGLRSPPSSPPISTIPLIPPNTPLDHPSSPESGISESIQKRFIDILRPSTKDAPSLISNRWDDAFRKAKGRRAEATASKDEGGVEGTFGVDGEDEDLQRNAKEVEQQEKPAEDYEESEKISGEDDEEAVFDKSFVENEISEKTLGENTEEEVSEFTSDEDREDEVRDEDWWKEDESLSEEKELSDEQVDEEYSLLGSSKSALEGEHMLDFLVDQRQAWEYKIAQSDVLSSENQRLKAKLLRGDEIGADELERFLQHVESFQGLDPR